MLPSTPNPPGDPRVPNIVFPGILAIGVGVTPGPPGTQIGLIDGLQSFPPYPNVPTAVPARDPFVVTAGPPQVSWTAQMEKTGTMRPPVTGLTS
jgi:hypothetical protein